MAVSTERRTRGRIDLAELARLPSFYFPQLSYQRDRVAFYSERTGRIELLGSSACGGRASTDPT
jgi:hypothetical protein